MEDLCNRFPSLIPMILKNVDNQSLVNFKDNSKDLRDFVESERFYWIRIIEKYKGNFEEFSKCWKKVIERTPKQIVKRIALAVEHFFNTYFSNDIKDSYIFIKRYKQWSPLQIAAGSRDPIFLQHVIEKTKFENHKSVTNSLSPLHMAAIEGDLEACELILNNFFEMGTRRRFDGYYEIPLDYAVTFYHFDVCKFLWDNSGDQNLLQISCSAYLLISAQQGNFEVFNLFFQVAKDKQFPLNPPGWCNRTPLHHAAHKGHFKICKLILEEVEERNPREDLQGDTPLHYAIARGHLEVYKLIADSVQDKNPVDNYGITPFELAARRGNFAACKLIMNDKGIWQKFNTFFRFIFYHVSKYTTYR